MFERRSPLAAHLADGGRDGVDGGRRLRLGEIGGWHLVQVGELRRSREKFRAAFEAACGCAPPGSARVVTRFDAHRLYRVAADQTWIVTADARLPAALVRALAPDAGTSTVLTHARCRLAIDGDAATSLLGHLVPVDLRDRNFPVGAFAQTSVHHTPVLLERVGARRYEMYVLRTFAASTWEWIIDSALPYGYDLQAGQFKQEPQE